VLITLLRKRIKDERFISLIWKFLKAGYLENWQYHTTYTGTPQGSIISPILSNIYLNELDEYMMEYKKSFD
ncbi:reverse transcriptase domain-containing protein, partial [Shouchella clausii]